MRFNSGNNFCKRFGSVQRRATSADGHPEQQPGDYPPPGIKAALIDLDIAQQWFDIAEQRLRRAETAAKRRRTDTLAQQRLLGAERMLFGCGHLLVVASDAYVAAARKIDRQLPDKISQVAVA